MRGSHNQASAVSSAVATPGASRRTASAFSQGEAASAESQQLQRQQKFVSNSKLVLAIPHATNIPVGCAGGGEDSGEFKIDLGDLTLTPRRRVSSVPASTVLVYRLIRRALGWLTCFTVVSELALGVADIVIGFSIMSATDHWVCSTGSGVGASVFASGITGIVFCFAFVATHYLATGNTVVHSSITALLLTASLGHTCSALPRLQLSYLAVGCTAKANAYLLLTGFGRLATLILAGIYYGLLNYFVCRFGEDNTTTSYGSSHSQK